MTEGATSRDSPEKGAAIAEAAIKATERKLTAFIVTVVVFLWYGRDIKKDT